MFIKKKSDRKFYRKSPKTTFATKRLKTKSHLHCTTNKHKTTQKTGKNSKKEAISQPYSAQSLYKTCAYKPICGLL